MKNAHEIEIDHIINDVVTEVLCIAEFAEHGTGPEDEERGPPPDKATSKLIDKFAEDLRERLLSLTD